MQAGLGLCSVDVSVVDYMLCKYIVAQYTAISFIDEAGAVSLPVRWVWKLSRQRLTAAASRDAAGLAGRKWLLEQQNYETLARDYLQKIEACVKASA